MDEKSNAKRKLRRQVWREKRIRAAGEKQVKRCHGCARKARDAWEHAPWCEHWHQRDGEISGL